LYLKIPYEKDKFTVRSNVKLNMKKPEAADLYRGQSTAAECELGAWYNVSQKKAGVFLKLARVDFEQDPVPK
jgi:hypothetical protein